METNTRTKTIKVHTLVIDDTEIEAWLNDPDPLIDALRTLLIAKAPPTGNGHGDAPATATRRSKTPNAAVGARRKSSGKVPCPYCARQVSVRQIGNHKNKCPQRPVEVEPAAA